MRYWVLVASKEHVLQGVASGFAQACHGKSQPLSRMNVGDQIIYYSPKCYFNRSEPCQEFTALGKVVGQEVYHFDMGNGFVPYRRDVQYFEVQPVPIRLLLKRLSFIKDKKHWAYPFRFGAFEILHTDFELISYALLRRVSHVET